MNALHAFPTTVYRLYGRDGRLLYVGITANLRIRFAGHAKTKPWWSNVDHSKTVLVWCSDRHEAEVREARAIKDENPLHNVDEPPVPRAWVSMTDPLLASVVAALREASKQYREAQAECHDAGRDAMTHALDLLRAGDPPTEVARLTPLTDSYIRKAAREANIPPARPARGITAKPSPK